jgi:Flp pilus assembly protein TadG
MRHRQTADLRHRSAKKLARKLGERTRAIWTDQRGVAAIEFGFFAIVLAAALANVTDVSIYIYQRMQAENATQIAAQAAWKACDLSKLPAIVNCQPALTTAMQSALTSTSLGTRVSLMPGSPSEGYYCVNSSNALQYVGDVYSKPADCTAAGMPSLQPGDYIQVQTTFTYTPLFPGLSVASTFATPINRTAFMRLG